MYKHDKRKRGMALGVPVLYGTVEAVVLTIFLLVAWRMGGTYAPPSDSVCKMLVSSYQVEAMEASQRRRGLEMVITYKTRVDVPFPHCFNLHALFYVH